MKWFAPLTALLVASAAQSLPLNVAETTDFAGSPGPPTFVGTLDLGVNMISGHVDQTTDPAGDLVSAELPAGLQITALTLELSSFASGGVTRSRWALLSPFTELESKHLTADGTYAFTNGLPVSAADIYGFGNEIAPDSSGTSFDWKWNITVESVPEPASALLLAVAMLALARSTRPTPR